MKIRYYGHVGQSTGYGKAASDMCMALMRAGVDLEIRSMAMPNAINIPDQYLPLANLLRRETTLDPSPDAIIVHTMPLDCERVLNTIGYGRSGPEKHPLLVAYTTWEAHRAPSEVTESLGWFDQVWSPSGASASSLALGGRKVQVMPHCFDEETLPARRHRPSKADRGDRFRFYYVGAWTHRKDPIGLVRAFAHAFSASDPVVLHLRCAGMGQVELATAIYSTGIAEAEMPMIQLHEHGTDDFIRGIHRASDCFVTATHGEAWNLPAFDAMLAGRHVIAPAGQGSDEFLRGTSADLYPSFRGIPHLDVRIMQREGDPKASLQVTGAQGLTAKCTWDQPNLLELAEHMRSVARHRVSDLTCSYNPIDRFGYTAVGKLAFSYLTENPS